MQTARCDQYSLIINICGRSQSLSKKLCRSYYYVSVAMRDRPHLSMPRLTILGVVRRVRPRSSLPIPVMCVFAWYKQIAWFFDYHISSERISQYFSWRQSPIKRSFIGYYFWLDVVKHAQPHPNLARSARGVYGWYEVYRQLRNS